MTKERDTAIDLMRFIGITMIIIAHAEPGDPWFQLRTFDVPMMLFISGLSYSGRQISGWGKFVWKRTKRLLVPLYIFLTAYFIATFIVCKINGTPWFTTDKVIGTCLLKLNPSIGFTWIFRIFLIVMLLTPPLLKLESAVRNNIAFMGMLAGLLLIQTGLILWFKPLHLGWFVRDWVLYAVGYSVMFLLGARMRKLNGKSLWITCGTIVTAMAIYAFAMEKITGSWLQMQADKYPPGAYFLLWGACISSMLWATRKWWKPLIDNRLTVFIGQNTNWLYLWHMPVAVPFLSSHPDINVWLKITLLYLPALLLCLLQASIVKRLKEKKGWAILDYFKG